MVCSQGEIAGLELSYRNKCMDFAQEYFSLKLIVGENVAGVNANENFV